MLYIIYYSVENKNPSLEILKIVIKIKYTIKENQFKPTILLIKYEICIYGILYEVYK